MEPKSAKPTMKPTAGHRVATDTKVRPRATGFRNEGTTNQFVICTLNTDNGPGGSFGTAPFIDAGLLATSLDGVARDVQCTGVNSFNIMGDQQFVTKTQNTGTTYTQYWWTEGDFGVSDGSFARITTDYGQCTLKVVVTAQQQRGMLFAPIHWSEANSTAARVGSLVARARRNLRLLKVNNVRIKHGDGSTDLVTVALLRGR